MAEKSILATYELPPVASKMLQDIYYKTIDGMPLPEHIFGLELEIENWKGGDRLDTFQYTVDGSLRGNGVEMISYPTKAKHIEQMLTKAVVRHQLGEENYSERCSTHVHMNVQEWSWNDLKTLCLLYQMFERLLFNFVGNDRKDNIFCVPWYESGITPMFLEKMQKTPDRSIRQWVKYSALNLLPVGSQGTVEFRHLHGTSNVALIMQWVRLLSRLAAYAMKTSPKTLSNIVLEMNTVSNYDQFMTDVFAEDRAVLMVGDYQMLLSVGVVDTKLMLMKPKASKLEKEEAPAWAEAPIAPNPFRAAPRPLRIQPQREIDHDALTRRLRQDLEVMRNRGEQTARRAQQVAQVDAAHPAAGIAQEYQRIYGNWAPALAPEAVHQLDEEQF